MWIYLVDTNDYSLPEYHEYFGIGVVLSLEPFFYITEQNIANVMHVLYCMHINCLTKPDK